MKLPIEQQSKTAATDWFILYTPTPAGKVALPVDWLAKDVGKYDGEVVGEQELNKHRVDWRLSKGSLKSSLKDMDALHATVNDVYTLVDEGYVDGRKAILAFR